MFTSCGTNNSEKAGKKASFDKINLSTIKGNWVVTGYYFAGNVTAMDESEAKKMVGKSVLRIHQHDIADSKDSCAYDKIGMDKLNADKYFEEDKIKKENLKISSKYIIVVSFKGKDDSNECGALSNEIIAAPGQFLFYIDGVYFIIKHKK
ncbi:hypothetical protein BEL04_07370 [Mucilaginibacter sp. PPCGB 2223]|nr:hypothetical protein BEL04_07370 [Mucilaginibacter sp. PPCGB 2223]